MGASRDIEAQAAALEELRTAAPEVAEAALFKALQDRNNYIAAKAAKLISELKLESLTPELTKAFYRFLPQPGPQSGKNPAKTDPQCWAKNAIAKALASLQYQEHDLFLAGMRHIQLEPIWGGTADTGGPLRGTCALALVQCRSLNSTSLLAHLSELFADKELPVRVDAARAVEQVGSDAAMLLLRLCAELVSDPPELLGACYSGVLHLEGASAIPWAAKFLTQEDDAAVEAAIAVAETRTPLSFTTLEATFEKSRNPLFRTAILSAIALTRQDEAFDWLIHLILVDDGYARDAHDAIVRSGPPKVVLERLAQLKNFSDLD